MIIFKIFIAGVAVGSIITASLQDAWWAVYLPASLFIVWMWLNAEKELAKRFNPEVGE